MLPLKKIIRKKKSKKPIEKKRNEAKNIPKNSMKAIVKFINSRYDEVLIMFNNDSVKCFDFMNKIEAEKRKIFSVN